MCELFAMSSKVDTTVSFSLRELSQHGGVSGTHIDGWGVATYQGINAFVYKEAEAAAFSQKMKFIQAHPYQTRCVISHIRKATIGEKTITNTQPFIRTINGRSHVFAHNGHLPILEKKTEFNHCVLAGETDSEKAFCYLLSSLLPLWQKGEPELAQRVKIISKVFTELAELGIANFLYSDGDYLFAFANRRIQRNGKIEAPGMHYLLRKCVYDKDSLNCAGVDIGCEPQQALLFASVPLTSNEHWQPLPVGQLFVANFGDLVGNYQGQVN